MGLKISVIPNNSDKRVAVTPESVRKYLKQGIDVILPTNVGIEAGFSDEEYLKAGAKIEKKKNIPDADIYLSVKPCFTKDIKLKSGVCLVAMLSHIKKQEIEKRIRDGISLFNLEKVPRITRAQSVDILSSQANLAGYRAVIEALYEYHRIIPLMMTAAGTIRPAKVLILGAGVAGLQAIATARRLGANVYAFDVRAAAKEQVESLGASFIEVENNDDGESVGGYAKEMSIDYQKRQAEKLAQAIANSDIVISTAQIPGKPAPKLITKEMVKSMPIGSVIVDLATETGGNCALSEPDKIVHEGGVTIIGYTNLASRVADDASRLFAQNAFNFISLMVKDGKIDLSDEIIQATQLKME
ncbi:MAG: Re/Si-specific NAD(P)(+) transhydrogenase subunit alpha [Holosporaceae bacterium]|jgi:NAD(P) transhydrogenase subunit alpha|nr:Re/Si-specific NAD(P)(+) transhydrogenase subunit alpha [Holosporaceae bacterium]